MSNVMQFVNVKSGLHTYWPEMGSYKPAAQLEASLSYNGAHYFIDTPLQIKTGRSVKLLKQYKESDFVKPNYYKTGWYEYKVTSAAFKELKKQYSISYECLLD